MLGPRRFAQWLVVGDERLLLVDSGIDGTIAEHVVPALAELGRRPEEITDVVVSHADVDHYGGNAELRRCRAGARIRVSRADRPLIESWAVIARERYGWYRRHGLDYDEATWAWLENAAGPDTPIDGTVADGEILDLGGIEVEVLGCPGHSPGHLGVLHRESGTAIVMDAVLERGLYTTSRRADRPTAVRVGSRLPRRRSTPARARARPGSARATTRRSRAGRPWTAFLDATASVRGRSRGLRHRRARARAETTRDYWRAADDALGPFSEMGVELARSVAAHLDLAVEEGRAVRSRRRAAGAAWAAPEVRMVPYSGARVQPRSSQFDLDER